MVDEFIVAVGSCKTTYGNLIPLLYLHDATWQRKSAAINGLLPLIVELAKLVDVSLAYRLAGSRSRMQLLRPAPSAVQQAP